MLCGHVKACCCYDRHGLCMSCVCSGWWHDLHLPFCVCVCVCAYVHRGICACTCTLVYMYASFSLLPDTDSSFGPSSLQFFTFEQYKNLLSYTALPHGLVSHFMCTTHTQTHTYTNDHSACSHAVFFFLYSEKHLQLQTMDNYQLI